MQALKITEEDVSTINDYNSEPVYYCNKCLSLKIMSFGNNDYCDDCGNTDIETTDIESWKKLYKNKYGKEF